MSGLEAVMMVCFGFSWPASIWKTWTVKNPEGKSLLFLVLVEIGYLAGIANKLLDRCDWVVVLYIVNALMVLTDLVLVLYYRRHPRKMKKTAPAIQHAAQR